MVTNGYIKLLGTSKTKVFTTLMHQKDQIIICNTNILGCNGNIVSTECLDKALSIKGPSDVGSFGQCPSPAYKSNRNCCCGNGCCWNKCTWDNPPDDCLDGVIKGQWMFDTKKGYFTAVKYWSGSGMNYLVISFPFTVRAPS